MNKTMIVANTAIAMIIAAAILLALTTTFLATPPALSQQQDSSIKLVSEKQDYSESEKIIVGVELENITEESLWEKYELTIRTNTRNVKYVGQLKFPLEFSPLETGKHTIMLVEKSTGTPKSLLEVEVGSMNVEEQADSCEQAIISTAKETYGEGEKVILTTNAPIDSNPRITITTNTRTYTTVSSTQETSFTPQETGKHTASLICNGKIISTAEFTVESQPRAMQAPPIQAPGVFTTETSQGVRRITSINPRVSAFGLRHIIERPIQAIERITFNGLNTESPGILRIEDRDPVPVRGIPAVRSYAIDPTSMDFETATITAVAQGTSLHECKDYNFTTQECYGRWQKVRDLEPGEIYTFSITPEDPLYSELNDTIDCSCSFMQTSQDAQIDCDVTCEYTIQVPEDATSFFLDEIIYNVDITMTSGGTITAGLQEGHFDNDDTLGNGNEILVGSSTFTSSTTTTWTNSDIDETGSQSFNQDNCDNWPDYCTYYVHLYASLTFTTPGASTRTSTVGISLNWINHTLNYTEPGAFAVVLQDPPNNHYTNQTTKTFTYIPSSEETIIEECSIYTNETSWSAKNTSTSIINATENYIDASFSSEGTYAWNVQCIDDESEEAWAPTNRIIHIDTTPPTVNLMSPDNDTTITDTSVVTFYFNVSDSSPIANCSLLIDGNIASARTSISRDTQQSINHVLGNGAYNWSVMCYDVAGNYNESERRLITINTTPVIYTGLWYETSTVDCTVFPCEIGLAQETDGIENTVSGSLAAGLSVLLVEASSPFMGSNGAHIPEGSTVTFSTFFSAGHNSLEALWYLYKQDGDEQNTLICSNTAGATAAGGATTGTCSPLSDVRILSTDKLFYEIVLENTQTGGPSRPFTHLVDHDSSYVNIPGFVQIGTLYSMLVSPTVDFSIGQSGTFNLTCNVTCEYGSCLDTEVYAQTNYTGSWTNIAGSGPVTLRAGQSNPNILGDVFNTTEETTFTLNATNPGITSVRCYTETLYSSAATDSVQVEVISDQAPLVALISPENDTWVNTEDVTFTYTPTTFDSLDYCELYIDGVVNQTDSSPSNGVQNTFTINNAPQVSWNWSVSCVDSQARQGNSSEYIVHIDYENPSLVLFEPLNNFETPNPDVFFNWTASDNRADTLTCDIYINGTLEDTIIGMNGSVFNTTLTMPSIGNYSWSVTCTDYASNFNASEARNFSVTDEPPIVELLMPGNDTGVNTTSPYLYYNVTDYFGLQSCSLYFNGVLNQTDNDPDNMAVNNFSVSGLSEDIYNWSVECTDINDNTAQTHTWYFYVDITPPVVTLISPLDESYFEHSTIEFSYNVTDNWDPLTCTIYVDGQPNITTNTTSGSTVVEIGTGYSDGVREWFVSCVDIGGNTDTTGTWTFEVNQTPTIILESPFNATHLNTQDVTLFYTAVDNDGINTCELYVNGVFNQSSSSVVSGEQSNFSLTNLDESLYNWSITCIDDGIHSNTNTSETWEFTVDVTEPTVALIDPAESQVVETSTHVFMWNATDNFSENLMCDVYLNDALNASGIPAINGSLANHTIEGLQTGDYNWSVACTDMANNTGMSATVNFTVLLPPKINLVSPEDETGINPLIDPVVFTYIPREGSGEYDECRLIIDGVVNQTDTNISFDAENNFTISSITDGSYEWNVECTDTNSLTGSADENWTVYIDSVPPYNLTIIEPENNSVVIFNNVSFSFIVEDETSPELYCDIYLAELDVDPTHFPIMLQEPVENGTLFTYNYILSDGNYSWFVFCEDKVGLFIESDEHFFEVDAPPNVTLISPLNYSWFNTDSVTLTYFPEDDIQIANCELYVNGVLNQTTTPLNPALNKQNNTFELENLAPGEYNWTVACTDSDANTFAPPNWSFYVDMEEPSITLHNPFIDELLDTSTVLFNWTATDNLSPILYCDLYINGSITQPNIEVNNSEPYSLEIPGFGDGDFNWSVECADLANNSNISETRNFSVQEPPTVILGNPENEYRTNETNITFFFTSFDNSGEIDQCTLLLNGVPNQTNTNVSHGVEANFSVTGLAGGSYAWDVNCTDPSGNSAVNGTPRNLHIDLFPPIITLLEPEVDETFNFNNITFLWNAVDFNESVQITCDLYITDPLGDRLIENITGFSGQNFTHTEPELEDGEHFWNVTCSDDLGNTNTSETRRFIINQPDLYIDETRIAFNNTNPDLFETLNITANVSNIGGIDANNVLVEFWQGHPDEGGAFIGNDTANVAFNDSTIFSVEWVIPEGFHEIHVFVDPYDEIDELNTSNNNASVNISVLRSILHEPLNGSIFGYDEIELNFTLQDYTGGVLNYTVFIGGSPSAYEGLVNDNQTNIINVTLAEGIREILIRGTDYLGRQKNSTAITIIIDLTPPVPVINTLNETWFNYSTPDINFTVSDNLANIIYYNLYVNGSLDVSGNASNPETLIESLSFLADGIYEITLEAIDEAGNAANATTIIIYVDTEPPMIVLESPDDEANFTTRDVELNYTVFDNMASTAICEVSVSGTLYGPFSVDVGVEQSLLVENLPEGIHYWNVSCIDQANNWNISETRSFNVFIPPEVNLLSPPDGDWSASPNNTFTYNVSDDTGLLECSLYLNGVFNQSDSSPVNNAVNNFTVEGMISSPYSWRVECTDNTTFNSVGVSDEWELFVDLEAPIPNITTENDTWFNTPPQIDFIITDNMASIINYTFYVDGSPNANGTVANNTPSSASLFGLVNGTYEVLLEATDLAGNKANTTPIIIHYDTVSPIISLVSPENDTNVTNTTADLIFNVTDNLSPYLICEVTLDSEIIASGLNVSNGAEEIVVVENLTGGWHYWNVTCEDLAGNIDTSDTWRFFIPLPDISVNDSEIFFSNENPVEGENITITATIRNIGNNPANDFLVQFWENEINISGGQIGNDFILSLDVNESVNISVNYTVPLGSTEIFVVADPENELLEERKDNNVASRMIVVQFWHYVLGTTNDTLQVTDASEGLLFDWLVGNSSGSNIYVTDYDSDVTWNMLQALGMDTSNQSSTNDFVLLDEALGSVNYTDSINNTYTSGGAPIETRPFEVFQRTIEDVPVVNSTNNSNFLTGILWDYSDGSPNYNGTQEVVFVTEINKGMSGYNSTNDFEIRIPATLREYKGPDLERVVFYTEIK